MKRQVFIKLLDGLKAQHEEDERISKAIDSIMDEEFKGTVYTTKLNQLVLDCLGEEMNDKWGHINYYVYETDWGERADKFYMTLLGGRKIKFTGAVAVYDYLAEEAE